MKLPWFAREWNSGTEIEEVQPTGDSQRSFVTYSYIAFVLIGIVTTMLGPLLPLILKQWQLGPSSAGTLFSWQFAGATTGTLFSAALVRGSVRGKTITGLLCCAAGITGLALLSWPGVGVAVGVYGIGLGVCIPAVNLAIVKTDRGYGTGRIAILNACWTMGALLGPLLLQVVRTVEHFLLGLGTAIVLLALYGLFVPMPATADLNLSAPEAKPSNNKLWMAAAFAALFFICIGTENAISGWITFYSLPVFHDEYVAMTSASIFWAAFLGGRLLSPMYVRESNRHAVLITSALVSICGIACLLFVPGVISLLVGTALAGFGFATIYPILIAQMAAALGAGTPTATICFAFSGLGAATIPYLTGRISEKSGNARGGLALSAVLLVLLISLYIGMRSVKKISESAPIESL